MKIGTTLAIGSIVIIVLLVLWFNCHRFVTSANLIRHRNNNSKYAHYSKVDSVNYLKYPNLLFTHPMEFELKKGECLKIPKKWWHWVKSYDHSFSVNFWFNGDTLKYPEKIPYPHQALDFSLLENEIVSIWNSEMTDTNPKFSSIPVVEKRKWVIKDTYANFVADKKPNHYIITLDNFDTGNENQKIKTIYRPFITVPEHIKKHGLRYDFNIWISSAYNDTGLHYDDEDGMLCVYKGIKRVTMYPPGDTPYLYPYELIPRYMKNKALNFRYNSFTNLGEIEGPPSSHLLNEIIKKYAFVQGLIDEYHKKHGPNKTIWGYKKMGNKYRLEFYLYNLDNTDNNVITSRDIFTDHVGDEEHYYHHIDENLQTYSLPFWGFGTYVKNGERFKESKIFVIDSYERFAANYDEYMQRLMYGDVADKFRGIVLDKYPCYEICIHNKTPGQIFVQYLGISRQDFIAFLKEHGYTSSLVNYYESQDFRINNEITIVYDTRSTLVQRTGFYGIF